MSNAMSRRLARLETRLQINQGPQHVIIYAEGEDPGSQIAVLVDAGKAKGPEDVMLIELVGVPVPERHK